MTVQVLLLMQSENNQVDFLRCLKYKSYKSESDVNAVHVPTLEKNYNRFLM